MCLLFRPFVAPDGREVSKPKRKLKRTICSFILASIKFAFTPYETSNTGIIATWNEEMFVCGSRKSSESRDRSLHFGSSFRMTVRYILFFLPALNFGVLRTQFWIRIGECEVLYAERMQRSDSWYLHVWLDIWGPFLETWPDSTSDRSTAVTVNERVVKGEDVLPSRVEFLSSHPYCFVYTVQKSRNATTYTRLRIRMII